jgi:hypothetical protein
MITSKKQLRSVEFFDESGNGYIVLDDEVFYEYTGWNKIYEDEYDGNDNIMDEHGSIVKFEEKDKEVIIVYYRYFLIKDDFSSLTHRLFGPAFINFYDGKKFREEWRIFGKLHREDGPAEIIAQTNSKCWYFNNTFLGYNKEGFWLLWDRLSKEARRASNILKYLVMFS